MNIKNTKKVKIRSKLQTITETFSEYGYDMETIADEWIIHFTKKDTDIKFMVEISSIDDTINNFKYFHHGKWYSYTAENFDKIIKIAKNKITEIYG